MIFFSLPGYNLIYVELVEYLLVYIWFVQQVSQQLSQHSLKTLALQTEN